MKQVTFLTGSMTRGGAERVISVLSNYLAQHGYQVTIVMLLHSYKEYPLDESIRVVDLSDDSQKLSVYLPSLLRKLRQHVSTQDTGTLVCFMAQICLITGLALAGKHADMISCERIDPHHVHRNAVYEKLLNWVYASSRHTVFQNTTERDYFPRKIRDNGVIIPNPIQIRCTASEEPHSRIVTAGRLTEQKNHKMLIRAFSRVHKAHPEYTLEIYGEGPLREELSALARSLGLEDCVTLHGNVPDIHEQIRDAACFVLSSDFEGLSNALLEAMMMGLPCISTDCAGSGDAIEDGKSGLLVPVGEEQALADAMLRLVQDEALRRQLGENGRQRALERYSVENVVRQWIDVIEK